MLTVKTLAQDGYGVVPLTSIRVPSDVAGETVSISICVEVVDTRGSAEIAKIAGYSHNGPVTFTGDRPYEHVEFYGDIYSQDFNLGKKHVSRGWSPGYYWSGTVYTSRYKYQRKFCVIKGGFTSSNGTEWEITQPSLIDDVWVLSYRHTYVNRPDQWGPWYTARYRQDQVWHFGEEHNSVKMLPWQHRLWEGFFEIALSQCDYYGNETTPHWGDLCQEAVEGTRVINLNTLMYCKELTELGSMVRSTFETFKDLKRKPLQAASSLYLSYHYGYRLSVKDTAELYNAAKHEFNSVKSAYAASRARRVWNYTMPSWTPLYGLTVKRQRCVKVWYEQMDTGIRAFLNGLFRWDVFPELGNVYDMIPYSFVVDWFLPFGDILDKIDYHTYSYTLPVIHTIRSDAYEVPAIPMDSPLLLGVFRGYSAPSGITMKVYHRWVESNLTYPPLQLQAQAGPKNWLPAGALILQRTK